MTNHKILIVDDEPANLRLLERLFRADYQVITASSGMEALELLGQYDVAVILSDQRMPGMTGIEFLKRAAQMRFHTVRIILTGYTDVNALVEAINSGVVYKYVSKPWANGDLTQTVARALEHHETNKLQYESKMHNERLEARLKTTRQGLVRLIAETLDLKDEYAHDHARRAAGYAVAIGRHLDVEAEELEQLELAAYLHDVGRIGFPDALLLRESSALSEDERAIVKGGSERAVKILAAVPDMSEIALSAQYVGERFDGGGKSPDTLSGERIPLFSRIVAVACAYDKMTSPRRSEPALTHDEAIERLRESGGKQLDPNIVEIFCRLTSVSQIRRAIDEGSVGTRLLPSRIFSDVKNIPTAELLQKFKTEPMMALDLLKLANAANPGAKTAQLMQAMSALGEPSLRNLLEHNGLPASDAKSDRWTERAARRATIAQLLAAHTEVMQPDEAYTLGLLYDAGEILLGSLFPEEMLGLEKYDDEERFKRQIGMFGTDSIQISRWMLEASGLPPALTGAVKAYRQLMQIDSPAALLLQAAHKISVEKEPGKTAAEAIGVDFLAALRLTRAELSQICERAEAVIETRIGTLQEL